MDVSSEAPLLNELALRLDGCDGPRILIDGLWFSRSSGGVSRVWEMILSCWSLPGLVSTKAPITIIDRNSHLALVSRFDSIDGQLVDPLKPDSVASVTDENSIYCNSWKADVFISSWISTTNHNITNTPELALIHDCLPERSKPDSALLIQRRRWLQGAQSHLAVSSATAEDVEGLLSLPADCVAWCHPGVQDQFMIKYNDAQALRIWSQLKKKYEIQSEFVLLPATSKIGSYKNPELLARALDDEQLKSLQLVVCGIGSKERCHELSQLVPSLRGRCIGVSLTDVELAVAYQHALAVVVPSRIEGFGLPAIEAIACGGTVIVANARGLKEAGAEAALRCHPSEPSELKELLILLKQKPSKDWIRQCLKRRHQTRVKRLNTDLLGLSLLAKARGLMISSGNSFRHI